MIFLHSALCRWMRVNPAERLKTSKPVYDVYETTVRHPPPSHVHISTQALRAGFVAERRPLTIITGPCSACLGCNDSGIRHVLTLSQMDPVRCEAEPRGHTKKLKLSIQDYRTYSEISRDCLHLSVSSVTTSLIQILTESKPSDYSGHLHHSTSAVSAASRASALTIQPAPIDLHKSKGLLRASLAYQQINKSCLVIASHA